MSDEKVKVPPCTCRVEREHVTMVHEEWCPRGESLCAANSTLCKPWVAGENGEWFMWAGRNGGYLVDYLADCTECVDMPRHPGFADIDGHHPECPRLRPLAEWCTAPPGQVEEGECEPAPPETMTRAEIEALIRRISEEVARKVKAEPVKIECAMAGGFDPDRVAAEFAERAKNGADPNLTKLRLAAAEKIIAEQDAELGKWRARDENAQIQYAAVRGELVRAEDKIDSQRREIVARDSALEEAHKAECHPRPPMVSEQSCCSGIFRAEDAKFLAHIAAQLPTEPRCEVCGAPVAEGLRACTGLSPCWREVWRRDHPEVKP